MPARRREGSARVTREVQRLRATQLAKAAAIAGVCCIVVLTADYVVASVSKPKEDAAILQLQKKVQEDSKLAPVLAKTYDDITQSRQARKKRIIWLSNLLIAAAALFVAGAKWVIALDAENNRPPRQPRLVQLTAAPATGPPGKVRKPTVTTLELDMRTVVDEIVAKYGRTQEAAVPILHAIQEHYRYLPDDALARVCETTDIRPSQIAGTSSFYSRFRRSPLGDHVIRVCHGTACHVSGARPITEELRRQLGIPDGADTSTDRKYTVEEAACLGCCSLAPVLMVDERTAGRLTPSTAVAAVAIEQETTTS